MNMQAVVYVDWDYEMPWVRKRQFLGHLADIVWFEKICTKKSALYSTGRKAIELGGCGSTKPCLIVQGTFA